MFPIALLGSTFLGLERLLPARPLPAVRGRWPRLLAANLCQLAVVLAVGPLTQRALHPLLSLDRFSTFIAGLLAYLLSTFLWYWWHRARHEIAPLWLGFHQVHHSPARIEVAMAFYKHPLEQVANALLSAAVAGPLFGLSPAAALVYATCSALTEFVYHANIRTPRWLGFFVQRPEMHRLHHARGHHTQNFADLPVWDMLFGTYVNPDRFDGDCGFEDEHQLGAMLLFQDVQAPARTRADRLRSYALTAVTCIGLASVAGTVVEPMAPRLGAAIAGLGKVSLMSPYPKVFCAMSDTRGTIEPWTWEHALTLTWADGRQSVVHLDREAARRHVGPYQYRNATGAAVAYGPWLPAATVDAALSWTACEDPDFLAVLGLPADPRPLTVRVDSRPRAGESGAPRSVEVQCPR